MKNVISTPMSNSPEPVITYATYMADPLVSGEPYQEAVLRVNRRLDSCATFSAGGGEIGFNLARQEFSAEAGQVVDFMLRTMPQGLTDAIFGELARRKASLFHVAELDRESPKSEKTEK